MNWRLRSRTWAFDTAGSQDGSGTSPFDRVRLALDHNVDGKGFGVMIGLLRILATWGMLFVVSVSGCAHQLGPISPYNDHWKGYLQLERIGRIPLEMQVYVTETDEHSGKKVCGGCEATFGPNHPDVAIDLNNLAGLLRATNRLAEAEPLFRRALAIDEASFGPNHPDVAFDLNNLAKLLQATNRLSEAEPLIRRAVEIFENSLGPDHPNTLHVRKNLERLLAELGKTAEKLPGEGT
jgi:tetratricopeptide (TPR) repeat protein